jgi:enoyl-CoA hydratase
MLTGRDVAADEAQQIGMVSKVVSADALLDECYAIAERISGFSQQGVELSKQMLWAGADVGSLHSHMNHEGLAQLFVRMTTKNFEEAITARKEGRVPQYRD